MVRFVGRLLKRGGLFGRGRPFRCYPATGRGTQPRNLAGLYRFVNIITKRVARVGASANVRRRVLQHLRSGLLNARRYCVDFQYASRKSTSASRRIAEAAHILKHKPLLNIRAGGGGRTVRSASRWLWRVIRRR